MKRFSFIALMALLMSCTALAIDAMLPALSAMASSLNVVQINDIQFVISSVFVGMGIGIFVYGPISDSFGRKPALYLGSVFFVAGCIVSILATSLETMIIGRVLQGFGAASGRIVVLAMVRDKFSGNEMAKITSLMLIIFILVPAVAPSLGQFIYLFFGWRWIFALLLLVSITGLLWLLFGQQETLAANKRATFSLQTIMHNSWEALSNPLTLGFTVSSGLIFGAFIGYLNSSPQLLQIQYQLGELFAIYFGCLAIALGVSSFINASLVTRVGMLPLSLFALAAMSATSALFCIYVFFYDGLPPLYSLVAYLAVTFLFTGILFSNLTTLALEPMGHIAGTANSVIGCVQTLLSVAIGGFIGSLFSGTAFPLVGGFAIMSLLSLLLVVWLLRFRA